MFCNGHRNGQETRHSYTVAIFKRFQKEKIMNKPFNTFTILVAIALASMGCSVLVVQAQPRDQAPSTPAPYEAWLGKSLTDQEVIDFIVMNRCSSEERLRLCKEMGLALGVNSDQVVETVFLYLEDTDGFTAYQRELPYRLRINDTREAVETKLKEQRVGTGIANEEGLFDHTHCWATYYAAGMTIIYNSPSADDRNAKMHAILVIE
jgi:hypothetical protein